MRRTGVLLVSLSLTIFALSQQGQAATATDFSRSLYRYIPVMRFDNGFIPFIDDGEHFFPLRVSAITNNSGNRLERGIFPNELLVERHDDGTGLNISYLRAGTYPHINQDVRDTDQIRERHISGVPNSINIEIYRGDAAKFQNDPHYRDRIYGHVVLQQDGNVIKGAWLQYWFFYYYNDFPVVDIGDHEGDWEMVQIHVNADVQPTVAVYAQHDGQKYCPWDKVPKERSRPVVFIARGSHASYFHTGHHGQDLFIDGDNERSMRLIRIGNNWPRWVNWPGRFGSTPGIAGQFESPRGPKKHDQYLHPQAFFDNASLDDDCK